MIKIFGRLALAAFLLAAVAPGLAMAAGQASKGADVSGGDIHHGCSPATTPCK